jgi:spermidine synthase
VSGGRGRGRGRAREPRPRAARVRLPVEVRTAAGPAVVSADRRNPSGRVLRIDGHDASYVDLDDPTHLPWAYVRRLGDLVDLAAPAGRALAMVHLGGGGCSLARYAAATRPGSESEVWELDEQVVRVAREHLGLRPSRRLRVRVGDARAGLARRDDASADVVVLDAFGGARIPHHLTTRELVADARRALRPGGLLAVNVIDVAPLELARAMAATLADVLAHVLVVADRDVLGHRSSGNVVLAASDAELPVEPLRARATAAPDPEEVLAGPAFATFAAGGAVLRDGVPFEHRLARVLDAWSTVAPR